MMMMSMMQSCLHTGMFPDCEFTVSLRVSRLMTDPIRRYSVLIDILTKAFAVSFSIGTKL
jgi:hypothetical protein